MPRKKKFKSRSRWFKAAMVEMEERYVEYEASIIRHRDQKQFDRDGGDSEKEPSGFISEQFESALHILNNMNGRKRLRRGRYYDPAQMQRRRAAMLRYVPEAVARFAEKFADLIIEYEFICLNALPCSSCYDFCEEHFSFSTAVAVFILDELKARGVCKRPPVFPD